MPLYGIPSFIEIRLQKNACFFLGETGIFILIKKN